MFRDAALSKIIKDNDQKGGTTVPIVTTSARMLTGGEGLYPLGGEGRL